MYYFFDWTFIILIPGVLLGIYAQARVSRAFNKWSQVRARNGTTGAKAAEFLLHAAGISNVPVQPTPGRLSDNYDPKAKVLRLSQAVYGQSSIAAIGVAAHETGHAIQDATGYKLMGLRAAMVPAVKSSSLWMIIFLGGLFFRSPLLLNVGIVLFSATVLFTMVTLPIEIDASRRAVKIVSESGLVAADEVPAVREVLSAAALTYVAAALMAILTLVRLLVLRNEIEG